MAVTPENVAVALGVTAPEPDSITDKQWRLWITDASLLIEARCDHVGVDFGSISEMKLDYVIREAVVAQVKKPDDATQVTVSVDDGSTSRAYQSSKGRVTILDEWWGLLGLVETDDGAFSIDMVPRGGSHAPWCSIYFGGTCSCGATLAGGPIYEPGWYV